jgi:hypothetical protein
MKYNVIADNLKKQAEAKAAKKRQEAEAKQAEKEKQEAEKKEAGYAKVLGTATLCSTVKEIHGKKGLRTVVVCGVKVGGAVSDSDEDGLLLELHRYAKEPLLTQGAVLDAMSSLWHALAVGQDMSDADFVPDCSFKLDSGYEVLVKGRTAYDQQANAIASADDIKAKLTDKDLTKILKERVEAVLAGIREAGDGDSED